MSTPAKLIKVVVARLERLERIRALMNDGWETTGDRRFVVRRNDVAKHVANALDCEMSVKLRHSIFLLGKQMGWRPIKNGNRPLFAGVKARGLDVEQALLASKELRDK